MVPPHFAFQNVLVVNIQRSYILELYIKLAMLLIVNECLYNLQLCHRLELQKRMVKNKSDKHLTVSLGKFKDVCRKVKRASPTQCRWHVDGVQSSNERHKLAFFETTMLAPVVRDVNTLMKEPLNLYNLIGTFGHIVF